MPLITFSPSNNRGFSLLEVMVALLIFSVGLIGLVGLQSTAVQDNSRALYRMQANFLAYDMLDRIRANPTAAIIAGRYDIGIGPIPTSALCGSGATCDANAMANSDRREWKQALADNLPAGNGSVARVDTTDSLGNPVTQFVITVQWDDNRDGTPESISIRAEL